ncbi:hypothetical protein A6R68_14631, partial [Neotoma lepida]
MNATLQCLSNTELFAEYLALGQYRVGRPEPSPEPEQPAGRGPHGQGEVTEQLAHLVRALWTLEYTPQHSRDFKSIVSKNALQYRGNSQHDAQEFLLWLLDRVHEDLNHAVKQSGQPPLKIVLTEMYYDGFHRSFSDTDDLETVHESDCIFAFETPEIFRPEGILSQR